MEGLKVSFEHGCSGQAQQWASLRASLGWLLPGSVEIKVVMRWLHVGVILCFP